MRLKGGIGIAVMTLALAAGPAVGRAGAPPKPSTDPPDEGLLEFLGSVDPATDSTQPDDGSWLTYLAQVHIGKSAKVSQAPPAPARPQPASAPAAAAKPGGGG